MKTSLKILVFGYGNPGRQDDGLAIQLVKELEEWADKQQMHNVVFEANYQLNIEDAEIIRNFDMVIFADASVEDLPDPVTLTRLNGENELSFTSHAASPGYVVHLCSNLFDTNPESYLLHIKGYEWGFKEGLSVKGNESLQIAMEMMKGFLSVPSSLRAKSITQ